MQNDRKSIEKSFGTDLALERRRADPTVEGVTYEREERGDFAVETVSVTTEAGAERLGKPCGQYVTLTHPPILYLLGRDRERLISAVAEELERLAAPLCGGRGKKELTVLVAGLGNRALTSDAIGPLVADRLRATRHLRQAQRALWERLDISSLCVCAPGVTAQTGMEASGTVADMAARTGAHLVVVVDALAARSPERLLRTVQLCDTGISPGSGIGNSREALDRETVGVPVLAIGVPTVVHTATLVTDAIGAHSTAELPDEVLDYLERDGFFVSPGDVDQSVEAIAEILAGAITRLWGVEE